MEVVNEIVTLKERLDRIDADLSILKTEVAGVLRELERDLSSRVYAHEKLDRLERSAAHHASQVEATLREVLGAIRRDPPSTEPPSEEAANTIGEGA